MFVCAFRVLATKKDEQDRRLLIAGEGSAFAQCGWDKVLAIFALPNEKEEMEVDLEAYMARIRHASSELPGAVKAILSQGMMAGFSPRIDSSWAESTTSFLELSSWKQTLRFLLACSGADIDINRFFTEQYYTNNRFAEKIELTAADVRPLTEREKHVSGGFVSLKHLNGRPGDRHPLPVFLRSAFSMCVAEQNLELAVSQIPLD
jgi:hypothetical protein